MKLSRYVALVERDLKTLLGEHKGRLFVVSDGPLPRDARQTLAGYAPQLVEYFRTGEDRDLDVTRLHRDLRALGLVQLETGAWTHSDGDHVADAIVLGVIAPADAVADVERRTRQADTLAPTPKLPPQSDIELRPGRYPGHFTFTLEAGKRYRPLPFATE